MNDKLTLQQAALDWAQGKRVEASPVDIDWWLPIDPVGRCLDEHHSPSVFTDPRYRFRLAPEPPAKKFRPWEFGEVPVGALTRHKIDGGEVLMIVGRLSSGALIAGDHGPYPFNDLLKMCEHSIDGGRTWIPCGVEVDA